MTFAEMLPTAQSLSRVEKLRLIQQLAEDLAHAEEATPLIPDHSYPLWSPDQAYEAAVVLLVHAGSGTERAVPEIRERYPFVERPPGSGASGLAPVLPTRLIGTKSDSGPALIPTHSSDEGPGTSSSSSATNPTSALLQSGRPGSRSRSLSSLEARSRRSVSSPIAAISAGSDLRGAGEPRADRAWLLPRTGAQSDYLAAGIAPRTHLFPFGIRAMVDPLH